MTSTEITTAVIIFAIRCARPADAVLQHPCPCVRRAPRRRSRAVWGIDGNETNHSMRPNLRGRSTETWVVLPTADAVAGRNENEAAGAVNVGVLRRAGQNWHVSVSDGDVLQGVDDFVAEARGRVRGTNAATVEMEQIGRMDAAAVKITKK